MSLARVALRAPTARFLFVRLSSTTGPANNAAKIQMGKPTGETEGFFSYARNWSRDPKLAKNGPTPQPGDLPMTFLLRRLGHAYEVYPIIALCGLWVGLFCVACYWSFNKSEIWMDRSHDNAPWDWSRSRDNYYKQSTILFDTDGRTRKRVELMEILQDEMLEAAKKRGTRK